MIPISVVISGGSFGFIMACGSVIRSDDSEYELNYQYNH
jgi:hypothetical protein